MRTTDMADELFSAAAQPLPPGGRRAGPEIVAPFLAVLELCRLRSVSVGEDENGEPSVTYLKTPDADVQTDIS